MRTAMKSSTTAQSPLKMKQLTSTYKFKDFTWSDGTKGSAADLSLGYKIDCDKESGSTSFEVCDQVGDIKFGPGLEYTDHLAARLAVLAVLPGSVVASTRATRCWLTAASWPTCPAKRVGDPARDRRDTAVYGPFVLTEWKKGESMTFTRNEYFQPAPALKSVVIQFFPDSQTAVAALLGGDVDYLEKATLGAGAEVQTALDAAKEGKLMVETMASPTWEHIDFNLFTK